MTAAVVVQTAEAEHIACSDIFKLIRGVCFVGVFVQINFQQNDRKKRIIKTDAQFRQPENKKIGVTVRV